MLQEQGTSYFVHQDTHTHGRIHTHTHTHTHTSKKHTLHKHALTHTNLFLYIVKDLRRLETNKYLQHIIDPIFDLFSHPLVVS